MERKEIFFCNLTLKKNKEKIIVNDVVYKCVDGYYKNIKLGIKEPLKVLKVDVIKSLGFENISNDFTEVKKSNEKRNNITGIYE
jgi:hypothetical protein